MLKSKNKIILLLFILAIAGVFLAPHGAHAAGLVPCGGPTESPCTVLDAFYMAARVTNWLILTAGIFAVYQIVTHGFWMAISMGNEEDIAKRKKGITSAIVGFFLVIAAYMFVNTAVNILLISKCKINFATPWTYITMTDPSNPTKCTNSYNAAAGIGQ